MSLKRPSRVKGSGLVLAGQGRGLVLAGQGMDGSGRGIRLSGQLGPSFVGRRRVGPLRARRAPRQRRGRPVRVSTEQEGEGIKKLVKKARKGAKKVRKEVKKVKPRKIAKITGQVLKTGSAILKEAAILLPPAQAAELLAVAELGGRAGTVLKSRAKKKNGAKQTLAGAKDLLKIARQEKKKAGVSKPGKAMKVTKPRKPRIVKPLGVPDHDHPPGTDPDHPHPSRGGRLVGRGRKKRKPSAWNLHVKRELKAGKTMKQAAVSWRALKNK